LSGRGFIIPRPGEDADDIVDAPKDSPGPPCARALDRRPMTGPEMRLPVASRAAAGSAGLYGVEKP